MSSFVALDGRLSDAEKVIFWSFVPAVAMFFLSSLALFLLLLFLYIFEKRKNRQRARLGRAAANFDLELTTVNLSLRPSSQQEPSSSSSVRPDDVADPPPLPAASSSDALRADFDEDSADDSDRRRFWGVIDYGNRPCSPRANQMALLVSAHVLAWTIAGSIGWFLLMMVVWDYMPAVWGIFLLMPLLATSWTLLSPPSALAVLIRRLQRGPSARRRRRERDEDDESAEDEEDEEEDEDEDDDDRRSKREKAKSVAAWIWREQLRPKLLGGSTARERQQAAMKAEEQQQNDEAQAQGGADDDEETAGGAQISRNPGRSAKSTDKRHVGRRERLARCGRVCGFYSILALFALVAIVACASMEGACVAVHPTHVSTRLSRWFQSPTCDGDEPCHVYLTLPRNASHGIVVNFHTSSRPTSPRVFFDTSSHDSDWPGGDSDISALSALYPNSIVGSYAKIEYLERDVDRYVAWLHISGLTPNTVYYFVVGYGDDVSNYRREMRFRTLPATGSLYFAAGGDTGVESATEEFVKLVGSNGVMFGLLGGDLAYANAFPTCYRRWDEWLDLWESHAVTPTGNSVPIIAAVGNHESNGAAAPYFIDYFAQGFEDAVDASDKRVDSVDDGTDRRQHNAERWERVSPSTEGRKTYNSFLIGDHTIIVTLDSDHVSRVDGKQADWLARTLQEHADRVNKFAAYHVPMFPSSRYYDEEPSVSMRKHWMPIFDRYNLTIGFENHDHAYKRTKRIFGGKVAEGDRGTIYIGDGSMGVAPRSVDKQWYIQRALSKMYVALVTATEQGDIFVQALNGKGQVLDTASWS